MCRLQPTPLLGTNLLLPFGAVGNRLVFASQILLGCLASLRFYTARAGAAVSKCGVRQRRPNIRRQNLPPI